MSSLALSPENRHHLQFSDISVAFQILQYGINLSSIRHGPLVYEMANTLEIVPLGSESWTSIDPPSAYILETTCRNAEFLRLIGSEGRVAGGDDEKEDCGSVALTKTSYMVCTEPRYFYSHFEKNLSNIPELEVQHYSTDPYLASLGLPGPDPSVTRVEDYVFPLKAYYLKEAYAADGDFPTDFPKAFTPRGEN